MEKLKEKENIGRQGNSETCENGVLGKEVNYLCYVCSHLGLEENGFVGKNRITF